MFLLGSCTTAKQLEGTNSARENSIKHFSQFMCGSHAPHLTSKKVLPDCRNIAFPNISHVNCGVGEIVCLSLHIATLFSPVLRAFLLSYTNCLTDLNTSACLWTSLWLRCIILLLAWEIETKILNGRSWLIRSRKRVSRKSVRAVYKQHLLSP